MGSEPGGTEPIAAELGVPFVEAGFANREPPVQVVATAAAALGPLDVLVAANHARSGHERLAKLTAAEFMRSQAGGNRLASCCLLRGLEFAILRLVEGPARRGSLPERPRHMLGTPPQRQG